MSWRPHNLDFQLVILLYLDPGTGSLVLQLLLAALLTIPVMAKKWWSKIVKFFTGVIRRPAKVDEMPNDSTGSNSPKQSREMGRR